MNSESFGNFSNDTEFFEQLTKVFINKYNTIDEIIQLFETLKYDNVGIWVDDIISRIKDLCKNIEGYSSNIDNLLSSANTMIMIFQMAPQSIILIRNMILFILYNFKFIGINKFSEVKNLKIHENELLSMIILRSYATIHYIGLKMLMCQLPQILTRQYKDFKPYQVEEDDLKEKYNNTSKPL